MYQIVHRFASDHGRIFYLYIARSWSSTSTLHELAHLKFKIWDALSVNTNVMQ